MVVSGGVDPTDARTASEYVALLRKLKEDSGLTYRQLERRAAERDDVLARSTLADVLRRDALPRADLVAALVRACGAERDVPEWLAARERLAAGEVPPADGEDREEDPPGRPQEPTGTGRGRTALTAAVASLGTVALLAIGAVVLLPEDDGKPTGGEATKPTVAPGPAAGFSRVRPARAPELCLTDGEIRAAGTDESKVVAAQRPCAQAVPPRTGLQRADDGLYQILFHHPDEGEGCLTVLDDGAFKGTLEPWNDCRAGGAAQWFRIERADGTDGWRLRSAQDDGLCVGIRGGAEEAGAAAVVERCAERGGGDQVFLIERE